METEGVTLEAAQIKMAAHEEQRKQEFKKWQLGDMQ